MNIEGFAPHFSYQELCYSATAAEHNIPNYPTEQGIVDNLKELSWALEALKNDVFRSLPVLVSSAFRSEQVNKLVGGVAHSAHLLGAAADITIPSFGQPLQICEMIKLHLEPQQYVQLIHEYGRWCHFAIAPSTISNLADKIITIDKFGTREGLLSIRG